jgi:hypothetical protein
MVVSPFLIINNYLKNLHVMGFMRSTGQLEVLLHAVEKAPALRF